MLLPCPIVASVDSLSTAPPAELFGTPVTDFTIEAAADPAAPKRFTMTAYTGGMMRLRGWPYPVAVAILPSAKGAGLRTPTESVPIDQYHNPERLVGHTTSLEKSPRRLKAAGIISGFHDTEQTPSAMAAREIVRMAGAGFPWQASIFADPETASGKIQFLDKGESANVNGLVCGGPCYAVWESTLKAISFVASGADPNTSATVASRYHPLDGAAFSQAVLEGVRHILACEGARQAECIRIYAEFQRCYGWLHDGAFTCAIQDGLSPFELQAQLLRFATEHNLQPIAGAAPNY